MEDTTDPSRNDQNGPEHDGDEQALEEVAEALPGGGRLEEPDDLDGAKGPIQVP